MNTTIHHQPACDVEIDRKTKRVTASYVFFHTNTYYIFCDCALPIKSKNMFPFIDN